jgi:type III restriction enzyme
MKLKRYQEKALEWLGKYYERCREFQEKGDRFPVATAFMSITAEIYGGGLPYSPVAQLPGIPYVCLRIPTGGGKTVVGCEAIAVAQKELLRTDRALILWLVPSDAIRRQTLDRMKDRKDPYRVALETKLGAVEVLDIEEALNVTRATLDGATVIVVATMQAFRRKDTSQLKVYDGGNGALMSHFENLPAELISILEKKPEGNFDYSLANVFRLRRPFVIVDEAHNNRKPLAFETLRRLNPSGVLELTATPNRERTTERDPDTGDMIENPPSNVLFSVSAYALKAEEMIKLPIYLRYREPWDELLGDAIGLLKELQDDAHKEIAEGGKYLRPIMLLQAQPKYQDNKASITVADVKQKLREFNIPEEQIAIHTGDIRDLEKPENLKVLDPACKLRFVITVQALKEGWDCPFAYVLFSVAELSSGRAVEQILGRILRMPHTTRKKREALNGSYAFVASTKFDAAAKAVKDGLVEAGFEKQEAGDLVVEQVLALDGTRTPVVPTGPVTVQLSSSPATALPLSLIGDVTWNADAKTLRIERPLNTEQEAAPIAVFADTKTKAAVAEACSQRAGRTAAPTVRKLSPSQRGEVFAVPVLAVKQGDFYHQFEADDLDAHISWSLSESDAEITGFLIPTEQRGIRIDITDNEKLQQDFIPLNDAQQQLLQSSAAWPVGKLVDWLDRSFAHPDLTEAETGIYLTRAIGKLIDERKFSTESLTAHRHRLAKAVAEKVKNLRKEARRQAMEDFLFTDSSAPVFVSAAATHLYDPNKYPYIQAYQGLELPNHFYPVIGDLETEGQEYNCARIIAHLGGIKFWVRNLSGEPECSFWIQTSSDKFYPDFVCELKNGKSLVVEYKAADWGNQKDNDEKERLGQLWEARSHGECIFLMIKGPDELSKIGEAIAQASR